MDKVRVVGRRTENREFGFERMEGFAELLNSLRGVDVIRPRGVFRFRTWEEADAWWEGSMTVRLRAAERQSSGT